MSEIKKYYIDRITALLTETADISLLDLIYKLLVKSKGSAAA